MTGFWIDHDFTYMHACDLVADWCGPEEVEFFDVLGAKTADEMREVLRVQGFDGELDVTSAKVRRGHWVGPPEEVDNFGLRWHDDPTGCTWTRATCEWRVTA